MAIFMALRARLRRDSLRRFLRRYDRMNLELDEIGQITHPLLEERRIPGLHDLVARRQPLVDPARNIREALGCHAAALPELLYDAGGLPSYICAVQASGRARSQHTNSAFDVLTLASMTASKLNPGRRWPKTRNTPS